MYTHITDKKPSLETKHILACGWHVPGLKTNGNAGKPPEVVFLLMKELSNYDGFCCCDRGSHDQGLLT